MVKAIRKYNRWFMAVGGVILMVAWLIGPSTRGLADLQRNKTIARLDGRKISALDQMEAGRDLDLLAGLAPGLPRALGMEEKDTTHWLLLTREAEDAGLIGDSEDGRNFADEVLQLVVQNQLQRDIQTYIQILQSKDPQGEIRKMVEAYKANLPNFFHQRGLSEDDGYRMLARAQGVFRMEQAYQNAARVSDRLAGKEARHERDAAIVDYVFIPASLTADQTPDPDQATLQAFFDKYKTLKPGEGEFGIGYLFPPRVKLEWLTLDRKAFEGAVVLDPVEVRKRYTQNRAKFPGEFAAERPNVEKEMIAEAADKAMQEAQLAIHAEILRATKGLDTQGKYKKLPPDWEERSPKLEKIAQAVVDQVKQSGMTLPLPTGTVKAAQWLTEEDLAALPGIGRSSLQQGSARVPFTQIISWTKELPGSPQEQSPVPIQTGLMLAETPLSDQDGNRYFIRVLATRGESAPDNLDEIKDRVLKDYKTVQAFDRLKGRADELRDLAVKSGLDAVVSAVSPAQPTPAPTPDAPKEKTDKTKVEVRKQAAINREAAGGDLDLNDPALRDALLTAAAQIDPMTPYGQVDASKAMVAIPTSKRLGLAVFHILSNSPLTREAYRNMDLQIVRQMQQEELKKVDDGAKDNPFTLGSLLKRHTYLAGEKRVTSPDELKRDKEG
jgi:hypothetical protein